MIDVVALGELLIDLTPAGKSSTGKDLFEKNAGGAPANVLSQLAKLGKKTAFIGKVGSDSFGRYLNFTLVELGIEAHLTFSDESATTLAFVDLDTNGERSFQFYRNPGADTLLRSDEVDFNLINCSRIFHFGSVSLTHEPSAEATLLAARFAKEQGKMVSFDPNVRPLLWKDMNQAKIMILEGLALADIVKISEEELYLMTESSSIEQGAAIMKERFNTGLLFITLAGKGCFYHSGELYGYVPGYSVHPVDTTGAGDAFFGGVLNTLLDLGKGINELTNEELIEMASNGNAAGAIVTTRKGAMQVMPTQEEIQEIRKKERS